MNAKCANCAYFKEKHWNRNHTFEIGRCDNDKGHGKDGKGESNGWFHSG